MKTEYCENLLNGKAKEISGIVECYEECPHGLQKGTEAFESNTELWGLKKDLRFCSTKGVIPDNVQQSREVHLRASSLETFKKARYFT